MQTQDVVVYMKQYALNKKVKELLSKINPLLARNEENIKVHFDALVNKLITEDEYQAIETKMQLGKLCLDLEKNIRGAFVSLLFYSQEENKIYHGAAPSFPLEFFDFFHDINRTNMFDADCGSCGYAVHNRSPVVTDIEKSPLWGPFREEILRWGFQTGWSVPFYMKNKVIGTFAIYFKYQKEVTNSEIQLVESKVKEYEEVIYYMAKQLVAN